MANTYTQMYVQIVFAVQGRTNLITESHRNELERYLCGIITNKKCKPITLFINPDHAHIFIGLHPAVSVSDLARDIKANTSRFINEKKWVAGKFNWQDGFGAFTYSRSHIDDVVKYILNQPKHHKRSTFRDEYLLLLKKFEVEFDEQYVFEFFD